MGVASWAFSTLRPASFSVIRMTGAPYYVDQQFVRDQFLARIVNKRTDTQSFVVSVDQGPGELRQTGFSGVVVVPPLGEIVEPLILQMPRLKYQGPFQVRMTVRDEAGKFHIERMVEFLGPDARLLREEEAEQAHGSKSD
jgi:hypothetical protein